ncbi:hypothetical protein D046_7714A, partial [Vibrio parahaemolyticus V-223/04]
MSGQNILPAWFAFFSPAQPHQ